LSYYYQGYANTAQTAFDLTGRAIDGTFTYPDFGANVSTSAAPWVLEQKDDLVLRMDPKAPWKPLSSWHITEPKPGANDAGYGYTDPMSIVEVGSKAYVALYTRDYIAVLDTSQVQDGGAPTKSIDLSSLASDADIDGNLEAIALAYDKTAGRVWVVLGNSNNGAIPPSGAYTPCSPGFHPKVVAIDTTTDALVPGVSYTLSGYGAYPSSGIAYDAKNSRLLITTSGCNDVSDAGDGGVNVGPTVEAAVESVSLTDGTDKVLLTPAPSYTSGLIYIDEHHAFLQSSSGTNAWDPTSTTIGALVAGAPDTAVYDGQGHLVGPSTTSLADGGSSYSIVSVDTADGGVTTLAASPFALTPASYGWESIDIWPKP
jgi:hypothetical protein